MPMSAHSAMPTRGSEPNVTLVDTSVAIALLASEHEHHAAVLGALQGRTLGLAGHAAFEAYSVLTRMPAPTRRSPSVVAHLLATNFPESRYLSARAAAHLVRQFAEDRIAGGSVFDALVGAAAVEHQAVLVTRDRRALDTYRRLGVDVEVLGRPD